ncbi:nucleotidyltransferase family protein [Parabacteroides sp. Marseille-P3160]|uniref:nucleotidyltransferase family protein n=1 Tax=Parabacteroides sp. Marseille-P3160 TaxID=1917887 RepID=UPI0009B98C39|nr:nucleotidyltransferase domain-containing protein [Parabacteroides sp. Marseille-P3160]
MNIILKNKLKSIKALCRQYKVKSLYSFGSINTNRFDPAKSDIDLLLEFDPGITIEEYTDNFFALHEQLTNLFSKKIDLVTKRSLSNPFFINEVEQTKQLLYGA